VTNGNYQVNVSSVSPDGNTTSVTQQVTVSRNLSSVSVNIYNEAGEVVRKLYTLVDTAMNSSMTNVALSGKYLQSSLVSGASQPATVQVLIQTTAGPVTLVWDGTNDKGSMVSSGEYQIEVHWNDGSGGTTDITRSIVVMAGGTVTQSVIVKPNVLSPNTTMSPVFDATAVPGAASLKVSIYTMAGELARPTMTGGTTLTWSDATGLSSGLYIAVMEVRNAQGGVINVQRTKILILR
jgi:hypothetical protein